VKQLLDSGKVDEDSKDRCDRTALSLAAQKGHEAVVKLLLDSGKVDVDSKDSDGLTPLWWAAQNGHEAVVKLLLDSGKAWTRTVCLTGRRCGWLRTRATRRS